MRMRAGDTLTYKNAATFWNGNQYAESLTCTSDRQLMPDKARLQCVVENASAFNGAGMESGEVTPTLQANLGKLLSNQTPIVLNDQGGSVMQVENDGNAGTLRANTHGNEQIVCQGEVISCNSKKQGMDISNELCGTLNATDYKEPQVVCYENHANDSRVKNMGNACQALTSRAGTGGGNLPLVQETAVAIGENIIGRQPHNGGNYTGVSEELAFTQNTSGVMGVASRATVRRLLPIETERLMAFPDNWTRIPWKGKQAEDCPDSPRYKAAGNSMCVNVMRWLGLRIELVERRTQK